MSLCGVFQSDVSVFCHSRFQFLTENLRVSGDFLITVYAYGVCLTNVICGFHLM